MQTPYNIESLKKRARAKYVQGDIIRALTKLNSPLKDRYEETNLCSTFIQQTGDKIQSRYCGHRWCRICNRIRTGKLINGYEDVLNNMKQKYFVTLTIPNVKADVLRQSIKQMTKTIRLIQDKRRKAKHNLITGIRKLECTYNPDRNDYHPHFHFIIDNENTGRELISEWLKRYPTADIQAQDIRKAENPKELFKYFTKLTSKSKSDTFITKNGKTKRLEWHYPESLDLIFQAIYGLRVIQPMGGVKMVSDEIEEIETQTVEDIKHDVTLFVYHGSDWIDVYTGEFLTGYIPSKKIQQYRKKIRYLHNKEFLT